MGKRKKPKPEDGKEGEKRKKPKPEGGKDGETGKRPKPEGGKDKKDETLAEKMKKQKCGNSCHSQCSVSHSLCRKCAKTHCGSGTVDEQKACHAAQCAASCAVTTGCSTCMNTCMTAAAAIEGEVPSWY